MLVSLKEIKFFLSLFLLIFFTTIVHAAKFPDGYPKCWKDDENPVNDNVVELDETKVNLGQDSEIFCPINSKLGHRFYLIDFTSPLAKAQVDWISSRTFGIPLVKTTPPYWKISYMKIDDTPVQSQKIAYSQCRMKTGNKSNFEGEKTNSGCEGHKQIQIAFKTWFTLNTAFKNKFLKDYKTPSDHSLIFQQSYMPYHT